MAATGPTFTDWEQVQAEDRRALAVEDFSWSEPPSRRRVTQSAARGARRDPERSRTRGTTIVLEREPVDVEREMDQAWGGRLSEQPADRHDVDHRQAETYAGPRYAEPQYTEPEYTDPQYAEAQYAGPRYAGSAIDYVEEPLYDSQSGRRMVVIRGQGSERRSFVPERPRRSELAFHERAGFSPDRTAFWAVLLGVTLLLGCFIH